MQNGQLLLLLGSFLLGGVLAAGAMFGWLSRQLKRERQRVHNVEQARQLAAQQVTQARKQIEQLQREGHELRMAVRPAPRATPVAEAPAQSAQAAHSDIESKQQQTETNESAKGFKDTVILHRDAG